MPLTGDERQWYGDRILELDPNRETVSVDVAARLVTYLPPIRCDESLVRALTDEECARALGVAMLVHRYAYPAESIYIEKYLAHGRPGTMRDEVDLVIYDREGLPYAMWEFKSPADFGRDQDRFIESQLFGTAPLLGAPRLLVYATVMPANPAALSVLCIDRTRHPSYESWRDDARPHASEFPSGYADPHYSPLVKGGGRDLNDAASHADFRAAAATLHQEFFGEHPDNVLYTNLMKCLLVKIYDERQTRTGQLYSFQVFAPLGVEESADVVFDRVSTLYRVAYSRYIDPGAAVPDEIDAREFGPERVKTVVRVLEGMAITRGAALHGDVIGGFFEEILRSGFKQDKGMYFTHANLVHFMIAAIDLPDLARRTWTTATHPENRLPYVIDPACGSGAFLLRAMTEITSAIRQHVDDLVQDDEATQFFNARLGDANPNYWAEHFLYGQDPKFVMAITAKVNMVLHGDGSAHMFKSDALGPLASYTDPRFRPAPDRERSVPRARYHPEVCESFDVVVSNPPFGITLSTETRRTAPQAFTRPLGGSPSEAFFLERWFQLLKPGGRLGVVVPESLLNTSDAVESRLFLYRFFSIRAIVSLPRNLFVETPTLTSLLFAQKKSSAEIAAWDTAWQRSSANWNTRAHALSSRLRTLRRDPAASVDNVNNEVDLRLGPILARGEGHVLRIRRQPAPAGLPADLATSAEAATYFLDLIESSQFAALVRNQVFDEVAAALDYDYPVYLVDEAGYKLSKRKERPRPNQLCLFRGRTTGTELPNLHLAREGIELVIDTATPQRVLDFIRRDVQWA